MESLNEVHADRIHAEPIPEFETDLKRIETLSQKQSSENQQFAEKLKKLNSLELDKMVNEISAHVSKHIDCTKCANCCRSLVVAPNYQDISRLAEHFETPVADFKKKYFKKDNEGDMVFKQRPCPFLKNNSCSVYSARPGLCRNYPYLDKSDFIENLGRTLRNLYVCPIVFNTFELLKTRLS